MSTASSEGTTRPRAPARNGWLWFAALVLFLVGSFNVIDGLVALFKDSVYKQGPDGLVVFNFTAWGWILLIIGVTQVVVAIALPRGAMWARLTALGILVLSAISQIAFITALPIWSVLVYVPQGDA
jgi:hypothetical protein